MKSRSILFLIIIFFFSFLNHAHAFLEKLPPEVIWRIINHIPPNPFLLKTIHQRDIIPDFARLQTMTSLRVVNKYLAGLMSGEDSLLLITLEKPYQIFVNREDPIQLPWWWERGDSDLKPSLRYFPVHVNFYFVPNDNDLRRLAKIQPNIRSLNFSYGYVHEMPDDIIRAAPISTFTSLTKLNIYGLDSLTDHFLYSLTNLQDLRLAISAPYPIHSIHHIPQLTKLHTLHLCGTDLKVFPSLSSLINLKTLTVRDKELTSTAPFAGIPHLTALKLLRSEKLREIDQLSTLTTLQDLNLGSTGITTLQPLTTLQKLKDLDLSRVTKVITFNPLSHLVNLESLNIDLARVDSYEFLQSLTGLKKLRIEEEYDDKGGEFYEVIKDLPNLKLSISKRKHDYAEGY